MRILPWPQGPGRRCEPPWVRIFRHVRIFPPLRGTPFFRLVKGNTDEKCLQGFSRHPVGRSIFEPEALYTGKSPIASGASLIPAIVGFTPFAKPMDGKSRAGVTGGRGAGGPGRGPETGGWAGGQGPGAGGHKNGGARGRGPGGRGPGAGGPGAGGCRGAGGRPAPGPGPIVLSSAPPSPRCPDLPRKTAAESLPASAVLALLFFPLRFGRYRRRMASWLPATRMCSPSTKRCPASTTGRT